MLNLRNQNFKVGMYIRLSREDVDKQESESISNQRKILQDYVKENDNYKDIVEKYCFQQSVLIIKACSIDCKMECAFIFEIK